MLWVGYGRHRNGCRFVGQAPDGSSVGQQYPVEGVHLEGAVPVSLPGAPLLFLGGSYFFHAQNESRESFVDVAGAPTLGRSWDADTQWWTAQALLAQPLYGGVMGVGGFRFDSWMTNFDDPRDDTIPGLPTDEADVTLAHYIPFVGLAVSRDFAGGKMNVGVVGFPTLIGSINYKETVAGIGRIEDEGVYSGGSFIEAFADYSVNVGGANMGVFGRYSDVQGRADIDSTVVIVGTPTQFDEVEFRLYRKVWMIGGKISVNFNLF